MTRIDLHIEAGLKAVGLKPADDAKSTEKKGYSEKVSHAIALAIGDELRQRGLSGARPGAPGEFEKSGAERRMAGGIGAKKVDVTWATEEAGLLLAISIKTINFRDRRTKNFQKNLTNRRGDMLIEAVTLHRRFPYAVVAGFFILDRGAQSDHTSTRRSTYDNAHPRLKLFTGRDDPAGRDEQFEKFYVMLMEATPEKASLEAFEVGCPDKPIPLETIISDLLDLVAERNPDFYEVRDGNLKSLTRRPRGSLPAANDEAEDEVFDDEDDEDDSED